MTIDILLETAWSHPDSYAGYEPTGEYVLATQHRDSDAMERSNYRRIFADLRACAEQHGSPDSVYDWRAGHCMVGWVEYLMVKPDAPGAVLDLAATILAALDGYPVYDEDDWSELEYSEAANWWAEMSVRDRADLIQRSQCGASIFAARRDYLPQNDNGSLMEYLR